MNQHSSNNSISLQLVIFFCFIIPFSAFSQSKIIGGDDVDISDYPWQVAVSYEGPDFASLCGGSIIGDSWVLTAAHCVDGEGGSSSYTINAGSSDNFAFAGETYNVVQVISHENYDWQWLHNDIALIQIDGTFNFSENIASIDLISQADLDMGLQDPGVMAVSTGWGGSTSAYFNDSIAATQLQMIEIPLVSNDVAWGLASNPEGFSGDIPQLYGLELELNYEGTTYAGDLENGGMSVNSGDSGGPLVVSNADSSGWLLVGIASGVYPPAGMPQYPASYVTVSHHLEWIFNLADVNSDYGCMDETACNYDAEALYDHGFCYTTNECGNCEPEPISGFNCYGECLSGEKIHVEVDDFGGANAQHWNVGDYEGIRGSYDVCLEDGCHTFYITKDGPGPWFGYNYIVSQEEIVLAELNLEEGDGASMLININSECTPVYGCYDTLALNYDSSVNSFAVIQFENTSYGSCIYPISGCTDSSALNFISDATIEDESCLFSEDCEGLSLLKISMNDPFYVSDIFSYNSYFWEFEGASGGVSEEHLVCVEPGCYTFDMNSFTGPGWVDVNVVATITNTQEDTLLYCRLDDGMDGSIQVDVDSDCDYIYGCTNPIAYNYDPLANQDNGFCHLPTIDCEESTAAIMEFTGGDYNYLISWEMNGLIGDADQGQLCLDDDCYIFNMYSDSSQAPFWMDPSQLGWGGAEVTISASGAGVLGFGTLVNTNSGSLTFSFNQENCQFIYGCTDSLALNYNNLANALDGSCIYPILGCTDSLVLNFSPLANTDDGSCSKVNCEGINRLNIEVAGNNIAWSMTGFNGQEGNTPVCIEDGCHAFSISTMDDNGMQTFNWFNADVNITNTDGEIVFSETIDDNGIVLFNFALNTSDSCIAGCTNPLAYNYDATSNADDGSCVLPIECEVGTSYVLMMSDSWPYGDHTNQINVSQTNGNELVFMFAGLLSDQNESFCLNDGCHAFTVSGQWADEISWELIDANQSIVLSGNGNETMMYSLNYEGECGPSYGCTDSLALNYDSEANASDGSCLYPVSGCMDPEAANYNPDAVEDNDSCIYAIDCSGSNLITIQVTDGGYPDEVTWSINEYSGLVGFSQICLSDGCHTFTMFDSYGDGWNGAEVIISNSENVQLASGTLDAGLEGSLQVCIAIIGQDVLGCTDSLATNFNSDATLDDASCVYPVMGCTDSEALNFSSLATQNDGSCEYPVLITSQLIELPLGWSLFSTYIQSNTPNFIDALSEIGTDLIIVKNNLGNAYLPEFNFNNIGNLEPGEGYQIKINSASDLTIEGTYLEPENNPINLAAGWSFLGYLRLEPADASAVLVDIAASANLIIAKDYLGNAYLPEWDFNSIGDLQPGQAYQLKLTNSDVLTYLSNEDSYRLSSTEVLNNKPSYLGRVAITDHNMTVVIEDASWDVLPVTGAEIAAYDTRGKLVGSVKYTSPVTVLTLWGDDVLTSTKEGLSTSEIVLFKLKENKKTTLFEITSWTQGSSFYATNTINVAANVTSNSSNVEALSSERVLLKVINVLGQDVTLQDAFKGEVLFNIYSDGTVEKIVK